MQNRSVPQQLVRYLLLSVFAVFLAAPAALAATTTQTLDNSEAVGAFTSVVLDGSGFKHISYYDTTSGDLMYATNASGGWVYATLDNVGDVGLYSSLALDGFGNVHISYVDVTNGDLKYATNASGDWAYAALDSAVDVDYVTSLAVDGANNVHISYFDQTNGNLMYANNALGWAYEALDITVDVGLYSSLAVDGSGDVHISYFDQANGALKYATNATGDWVYEAVDITVNVGLYSSLAVDVSGDVHISYYDATNGDLKYATNASGIWVDVALDSTGDVGQYTSLAVDGANNVHISYYDASNGDLSYATNASGSWVYATLDSTGDVGQYTSLAVDGPGNVHISYYDFTNTDLKYALLEPTNFTVTPLAGSNGTLTFDTPQVFNANDSTVFTVSPAGGFGIASVNGCGGTWTGNMYGDTYTIGPIDSDCTVTATFLQLFTITPETAFSGVATGSIDPFSPVVLMEGETKSFTVTPDSYSAVIGVVTAGSGCGVARTSGNDNGGTYLTGPITADCTVTANFYDRSINAPVSSRSGIYQVYWDKSPEPGVTYELTENGSLIYIGPYHYFNVWENAPSGDYTYSLTIKKDGDADVVVPGTATTKVTLTVEDIESINAPATNSTGLFQVSWDKSTTLGVTYELFQNGSSIYSGIYPYFNVTVPLSGTYDYTVKATRANYVESATTDPATTIVNLGVPAVGNISAPESSSSGIYQVYWDKVRMSGVKYVLTQDGTEIYNGKRNYFNVTVPLSGTYNYSVKATKTDYAESTITGPATTNVNLAVGAIGDIYAPGTSTTGTYQVSWDKSATTGVTYVVTENDIEVYRGKKHYYSVRRAADDSYTYIVKAIKTDYTESATVSITVVVGP